MSVQHSLSIQVRNPRTLPLWTLSAERIALGVPGDFKPSMALMPNGELVLVAMYQEHMAGGKMREPTVMWRSADGGKTWSERTSVVDIMGREQWLSCTAEGTLFATSHMLPRHSDNPDGVIYSYVHRSTDGGGTWQRTKVFLTETERCGIPMDVTPLFPKISAGRTSRTVVEMPDGSLLLGVGFHGAPVTYVWRSRNDGLTWDHGEPVGIAD